MPKLNQQDDLENFALKTSHYGFSGTRMEDLGSSEYTLVTIVQDDSSSVGDYLKEMEDCIKQVVSACQKSPRADNLLLRFCTFSNGFSEVHGFKQLQSIKTSDYDGVLGAGGMTALYDAAENAVNAMNVYGKNLTENDFGVNAIVIVITDGMNNASKQTTSAVRAALEDATKKEYLESMVSILVGVNPNNDQALDSYLQGFKNEAGITQYISISEASAQKLAKLADFVSRSISSQSQALGTGGPSQSLSF